MLIRNTLELLPAVADLITLLCCFSQTVKSASVEALNQNWNPFADDADSISDDVMFGQEFDRLRCGSQSSEFIFSSPLLFPHFSSLSPLSLLSTYSPLSTHSSGVCRYTEREVSRGSGHVGRRQQLISGSI